MIKINGVLVLYNPEENLLLNIYSYINEIDKLYVVDNSENKNLKFIEKIKKIDKCLYIDNHGNKGIAHALNVGAKSAIDDGANWLLTMDQDSSFTQGSLNKLIEWIMNNNTEDIGIISPSHHITDKINENKHLVRNINTVMTSGNLLSLKAYKIAGNFLDKLFIDYVDNEYCLRLKINNYKILQLSNSFLEHSLGDIESFTLFNKTVYWTNHNYIRRYYIARNSLYICSLYKKYFKEYCEQEKKRNIINIIKILFFEKHKIQKFKYIAKGIFDFYNSKYGKIS